MSFIFNSYVFLSIYIFCLFNLLLLIIYFWINFIMFYYLFHCQFILLVLSDIIITFLLYFFIILLFVNLINFIIHYHSFYIFFYSLFHLFNSSTLLLSSWSVFYLCLITDLIIFILPVVLFTYFIIFTNYCMICIFSFNTYFIVLILLSVFWSLFSSLRSEVCLLLLAILLSSLYRLFDHPY